jgi:DNA-binding transcriptional MerR regulator
MKPSELLKIISVAEPTLRRWSVTYAQYLSPNGAGGSGRKRSYSDQDARILAWIALMSEQNLSPDEITRTLQTSQADDWYGLPEMPGSIYRDEPVSMIPREAADERSRALRSVYEAQLEATTQQRDEAIAELKQYKGQIVPELNQKVLDLTIQVAKLQGIVEQYTIGNRKFSAVTIVIVAIGIGVGLTLLIIVLVR